MSYVFPFSKKLLQKIILAIILDFGPVILFLISFEYLRIYKATIILMIATIISTFVTYKLQKRLPYVALYVALLTVSFGYVTILHKNPRFMQIRDTMYDLTLALTLIGGLMFNKMLIKTAFENVVRMSNKAWAKITYSWVVFFLVAGFLNEYVRRNETFSVWMDYKAAMIFVTTLFGVVTFLVFYAKDAEHT